VRLITNKKRKGTEQLAESAWTHEDKLSLAKYALIAEQEGVPMTKAFDLVAQQIDKKPSAVGMYYYNNLRKELEGADGIRQEVVITDEDVQHFREAIKEANKARSSTWTKDEQKAVLEAVQYVEEAELPKGEAWTIAHKKLPHRTPAAISRHYYTVLSKEVPKEPKPEALEEKPVANLSDNTLLEAIAELPQFLEELNRKIKHIESIKTTPTPESIIEALTLLVKGAGTDAETRAELEQKIHENEALKAQLNKLSAENQLLKAKLDKIKTHYEDAVLVFDMFTNMASISQIMGLGDFKKQMRTTIDKWGNVLKVEVV